ncbi:MAG TPA: xylulokinase, partial [Pantoea sp.]|nr:xylulokinase [Pantoea sp.]
MFIGIDLGTSGVKVVLVDAAGQVRATETAPLQVSRPQPLWSEQEPERWWPALDHAMQALSRQHDPRAVEALALSGQPHGAPP